MTDAFERAKAELPFSADLAADVERLSAACEAASDPAVHQAGDLLREMFVMIAQQTMRLRLTVEDQCAQASK